MCESLACFNSLISHCKKKEGIPTISANVCSDEINRSFYDQREIDEEGMMK